MNIDIDRLITYFDLKSSTDYGDTTATISVVGEDLCAGIFSHYCQTQRESNAEILDPNKWIPTTLKKVGRRLDRWILETKDEESILYQTEIKNWCSRAIGGVEIPLDVGAEELNRLAEVNWNHHIVELESPEPNGLNKVLVDMISDKNLGINMVYKKEPLLLLWHATKPLDKTGCFFNYQLPVKHFDYGHVMVFSCSLYLRRLLADGVAQITVDLLNVKRRLQQLNRLFPYVAQPQ